MLAKECQGLLPGIHSLLGAVCRSVVGPEGMTCAIIPVELIVLPVSLELCLKLVDLVRGRVLVIITE